MKRIFMTALIAVGIAPFSVATDDVGRAREAANGLVSYQGQDMTFLEYIAAKHRECKSRIDQLYTSIHEAEAMHEEDASYIERNRLALIALRDGIEKFITYEIKGRGHRRSDYINISTDLLHWTRKFNQLCGSLNRLQRHIGGQ